MPFRNENTAAFGPNDLVLLTTTFDSAWQQLQSEGLKLSNEDEIEEARRRLARFILACAFPGRVEVSGLVEECVSAFNGRGKRAPT